MVRINKASGGVLCDLCKLPCEQEIVRFSHRYPDQPEDTILEFCSRECWEDYFDLVDRHKSEAEVRKECNALYKMICPSCVRRVREMAE